MSADQTTPVIQELTQQYNDKLTQLGTYLQAAAIACVSVAVLWICTMLV